MAGNEPLGFTSAQRTALHSQIIAFKALIKGQQVPLKVLHACHPPPLELPSQLVTNIVDRVKQHESNNVTVKIEEGVEEAIPKQDSISELDFESKLKAMKMFSKATTYRAGQVLQGHVIKKANGLSSQKPSSVSEPVKAKTKTNEKPKQSSVSTKKVAAASKPISFDRKVYLIRNAPSQGPCAPRAQWPLALIETSKGVSSTVGLKSSTKISKNIVRLMNEEADRMIDGICENEIHQMESGIEEKLSGMNAEDIIKYMIALRSLRLRSLQRKLRKGVIKAQNQLMGMKSKQFYRVARQLESKRGDMAKQDELRKKEKLSVKMKEMRRVRQQIMEGVCSTSERCRSNTKRLLQFHNKLLSDYNKVGRDDRRKRMLQALEKKDAEAYARLVREDVGNFAHTSKSGLDELSQFLDETERYLADLNEKVRLAKLQAALDSGDMDLPHQLNNGGMDDTAGAKLYDTAHAAADLSIPLPNLLSKPGLRSYQVIGLKWMVSLYHNHLNGILADEMGLGKTVQVIALLGWLMEYESNMGPHLIVVPNAVVPNWRNELKRWLPAARYCVYVGNKEQRLRIFGAHISEDATYRANVIITTYEYTLRDRSRLAKLNWKYVIMDEAHRIKDRTSKLADAVDKLNCERRLLLTGTPLQNDLQELWSLLNYLLPKVFDDSSKKAFREWFDEHLSNQHEYDQDKLAKRAVVIQRLHQALEPFMLRRQVEDVEQSLPPKIINTVRCAFSSLESVSYRWLSTTSTLKDIRGGYFAITNKAMELKKLCNHITMTYPDAVLDHSITELIRSSGKLFMLDRMLVKLYRSGHRVLLFSTMTRALNIIERYVKWRQWSFHRIDGTTPIEEREDAIQDFNNIDRDDGKEPPFIFLLSIRAAGRGLNLQSSDTVILYDPDPNPKNEEQAIARSHRIGQVREVRVFHMESVVDSELETDVKDGQPDMEDYDMEDRNVLSKSGRRGFHDSIESIIRKEIQKYKIDMANEVIDAGRFDLQTSKEEKHKTLQAFLQEHVSNPGDNYVPGMQEVNRMLARNAGEIRLFDQLDADEDLWPGSLYTSLNDVPSWLYFSKQDVEDAQKIAGTGPKENKSSAAAKLNELYMDASQFCKR